MMPLRWALRPALRTCGPETVQGGPAVAVLVVGVALAAIGVAMASASAASAARMMATPRPRRLYAFLIHSSVVFDVGATRRSPNHRKQTRGTNSASSQQRCR